MEILIELLFLYIFAIFSLHDYYPLQTYLSSKFARRISRSAVFGGYDGNTFEIGATFFS